MASTGLHVNYLKGPSPLPPSHHTPHPCSRSAPVQDINLRELTKKYGRGIGLNIAAVSKYSAQMLISLYHLRNCGVLHADVKPDNILVSASRTMVKLADFGSAMFSGDNEITPYLVSRFYRAPEVILGLKYGECIPIKTGVSPCALCLASVQRCMSMAVAHLSCGLQTTGISHCDLLEFEINLKLY